MEISDKNGRKVAQFGSAPFGSAQGAMVRSSSEANRSLSEANRSLSDGCRAESRQAETTTNRVFLWQPSASLGSGVYLVRATASDNKGLQPLVQTKRIVYLK